ncbi:hypothetical protein FOMG_19953 [Fusarium oxysporum f. sp. melonis 26406]|uniref:Uncharacterized protein n=1 Tax=Fusarium oxysporum f. sp. melonis 26406 TaxID=1089452 RepID=W9Z4S7_FUSOX|nr:hypothetical protein FOMG_19953 [Fusarium oxysporum f. sp. melonis 26406]
MQAAAWRPQLGLDKSPSMTRMDRFQSLGREAKHGEEKYDLIGGVLFTKPEKFLDNYFA